MRMTSVCVTLATVDQHVLSSIVDRFAMSEAIAAQKVRVVYSLLLEAHVILCRPL